MPLNAKSMSAPSATEPFIDRYRRVTPKWYPWIKRMIDSLRKTVLTVNTIETNVGTIDTTVDLISADLTSVELTIAALKDTTVEQGLSISNTITLVSGLQGDLGTVEVDLSTLSGNLTTTNSNLSTTNSNLTTLDGKVSTLETSINGQLDTIDSQIAGIGGDIGAIHARWAVAINGNNQVIGLVRLDGGASGSQFSVVADKFVVAHPTAPGTTITAFVVGLVNGVPTVGINGNVLVDGSILARHLSVSTLSAISADVGTVTAGLIRNSADTVRFDLPNMRLYRVDGKADFDLLNRRIYMESG